MKVRVLVKFNDLKEKVVREIGDEFIVSKSRYEEILTAGDLVEEVEEPKEETKEEPKEEPKEQKKETPKKKTSK